MRRHKRWLFVFLWVVIAAFIILYVPAFQQAETGGPGEALAEVGGLKVTAGEFQRAYLRQRQRMQQMYGRELDPAMLDRLGLDEQVLSGLVEQRLVRLEADRLGLTVDDDTLARAIQQSPAFQDNGRFVGAGEIKRLLDLQGISARDFEESFREQLLAERLEALVTDGVSVSPAEVEREFRRRTEQVKAEYALVPADKFQAEVAVTDDEARAAFTARREEFRVPEKRTVSYLLVDRTAQQARAAVTDAEIGAYYQEHRDEFTERRRPAPATSWSRSRRRRPRPRAIPRRRRGSSRRPRSTRSRRERTSRRSRGGCPRTWAPRRRAATSAARRAGAWCPSSTTPRSRSSPASSPTW
jgi:peptidyl-prolyl cis-trans isomerase D